MDLFDKDLQELVAKGKTQGYLTYDEVTRYLPDEAMNPEKLDNLLLALDERDINLVNEAPETEYLDIFPGGLHRPTLPSGAMDGVPEGGTAETALRLAPDEVAKWSNDPIRLYLSQMAEIPLLSREEEIALAKKIEVTRKRFRRTVLGCRLGDAEHGEHRSPRSITGSCPSIARSRSRSPSG